MVQSATKSSWAISCVKSVKNQHFGDSLCLHHGTRVFGIYFAGQEIVCVYEFQKFLHHHYKNQLLVFILIQLHPIHTFILISHCVLVGLKEVCSLHVLKTKFSTQ
jgi:hypothetical protein